MKWAEDRIRKNITYLYVHIYQIVFSLLYNYDNVVIIKDKLKRGKKF